MTAVKLAPAEMPPITKPFSASPPRALRLVETWGVCCKHQFRRKEGLDVTNPLQGIISVAHGGRESMLWCKPVIHVDCNASKLLNPSSAIECLVVQTAETEASTVVHDKDWRPTNLGRFGPINSNSDLRMVTCWDLPIFFHDTALSSFGVRIGEIPLYLKEMRP